MALESIPRQTAGIGIDILLINEKHLSESGKILVALLGGFLTFLFLEWAVLKFYEKDMFMERFNKIASQNNGFLEEWNEFKDQWKENKKVIESIRVSKSRTGAILDKFAKSNIIVEALYEKIKDDLELDEHITNNNDKIQKDFHSFISSLKYQEFLASHFIIKAKEMEVLQIPAYYFKNKIWTEFVDKAPHYYSMQLLDEKQAGIYLRDKDRLDDELAFLTKKIDDDNRTEIKKFL